MTTHADTLKMAIEICDKAMLCTYLARPEDRVKKLCADITDVKRLLESITASAAAKDDAAERDELAATVKEAFRELSHIENHLERTKASHDVRNRTIALRCCIREMNIAATRAALSSAQQVRQEPVMRAPRHKIHGTFIATAAASEPDQGMELSDEWEWAPLFAAPVSSEAGQQEAKPERPLDRWLVKARNLGYESIDQALNAAPPQLEMPQGSSYGDTLDMLYAAWHREAPGETFAAIGAAIQEIQALRELATPPQAEAHISTQSTDSADVSKKDAGIDILQAEAHPASHPASHPVSQAEAHGNDSDHNAPWLSLAHAICADMGIAPGHITDRLQALRDKLAVAHIDPVSAMLRDEFVSQAEAQSKSKTPTGISVYPGKSGLMTSYPDGEERQLGRSKEGGEA